MTHHQETQPMSEEELVNVQFRFLRTVNRAAQLSDRFQSFEMSLQPGDHRLLGKRTERVIRWLITTGEIK